MSNGKISRHTGQILTVIDELSYNILKNKLGCKERGDRP